MGKSAVTREHACVCRRETAVGERLQQVTRAVPHCLQPSLGKRRAEQVCVRCSSRSSYGLRFLLRGRREISDSSGEGWDLVKRGELFWRGSALEANGGGSMRRTIFSSKHVCVLMLTVRLWSTSWRLCTCSRRAEVRGGSKAQCRTTSGAPSAWPSPCWGRVTCTGRLMPGIFPHCFRHLASSSDSGMGFPATAGSAQPSSDLP